MMRPPLRTIAWPGALLVLLLATTALADVAPSELGVLRGDTLLVDLDQLVSLALEHNEQLKAGEAMTEAAGAQATGAWQGFLPQVSFSEMFMRTDNALNAFGYKLNRRAVTQMDFNPALLNDPGESNLWMTRLQLLQPIINVDAWSGKSAASAAARAARFDQARARDTVALYCIQAYEGLALALAYHEVVQAGVTSARAHVRQAQALYDAEMATEADLLQARVFLSSLEQQLIIVDNHVHQAGEAIRLLTTVETPLVLAVEHKALAVPGQDPALPTLGEVQSRQDLQAHGARAEAAAGMAGVAKGALLPRLNLGLTKDWYDGDSAFGGEADSWSLGVYATWDLFKGLGNWSGVSKANAEKRAAQHMHDFETRKAHHEAQQAWRDAQASEARLAVAQNAVEAARESLRIVSNQYREGLASMVDLLDVQAAATKAEGDLVQARHDHRVDLARLAHAAGRGVHQGGTK